MAYYVAVNTGKGFITHSENESAHVAGYPGDIWVTENTTWALRVGATSKTQAEAQALVDAAISFVDVAKMGGMKSLGHTLNVTSADLSVCTISSTSSFSARGGAGIYSRSRVTTYKNGTCTLNFVFTGTDTRKATSLVWSATVRGW